MNYEGFADAAMELLASLAPENADAPELRAQAWDRLAGFLDDPVSTNAALSTLVSVAAGMWEAARGESPANVWTFEIHTPMGRVPVDSAPPEARWVGRWLAAAMNGDTDACAAMWFREVSGTEAEVLAHLDSTSKLLVQTVFPFLTSAVREFLAAGRPLPTDFADRFGGAAR